MLFLTVMNPLLRNILAPIAGIIIGGMVNAGIISISGSIVPNPNGLDTSTYETLQSTIHLLQPKHYLMPWLAHALGTLVGALVAVAIGVSHHRRLAMVVGVFFLMGGLVNSRLIPAPTWFNIVDLVLAYLPMAYLGYWILRRDK